MELRVADPFLTTPASVISVNAAASSRHEFLQFFTLQVVLTWLEFVGTHSGFAIDELSLRSQLFPRVGPREVVIRVQEDKPNLDLAGAVARNAAEGCYLYSATGTEALNPLSCNIFTLPKIQ